MFRKKERAGRVAVEAGWQAGGSPQRPRVTARRGSGRRRGAAAAGRYIIVQAKPPSSSARAGA